MSINGLIVKNILYRIADVLDENKKYLTELDAAIGDGDHGINMSKGFSAVREKIRDDDEKNIGNILKKTGMALVTNVGGASGPLYGTAFLKAAAVVENKDNIELKDFYLMMEEALAGIKIRGGAKVGDKTMVDALEPAVLALRNSIEKNEMPVKALELAKLAAENGMLHTRDISARKGRASYLGERSIGHRDPGAVSSYLILNTIYEEIKIIKG